ncbi:pseudoazurin [Shimia sp. R10_1]|uniref:pseudoazurin n=1 Tax=Shimia sp. R10_1 TaxID=2821095 RepID=UPI001AD99155|nr:pseudoazurin [Shimia sp. R10_1]MBO9473310.1 pseudoazurin [Shimia sp. R10_1]
MTIQTNRRQLMLAGAALLVARPSIAQSTVDIQMLNKDPDDKKRRMIFKPLIQVVQPGDTVRFVSVDKGHNTQSVAGMLPDGAEEWKSKISKDFEVTLTVPGFYGYKCTPHTAMGMVGLIIVQGDGILDNYEAAKSVKHKSRMQKVWDQIWEQVDAEGLAQA